MNPLRTFRILLAASLLIPCVDSQVRAATFDGAARLAISDSTQSMTWSAGSPLTVSCWVKFSIPTGVSLTENMMIMVDRSTGTWTNNQLNEVHSYAIYLSATTGNIQFSSRGPGGYFTKTLVEKPFLERWYHLAVVRNGAMINGYVDARRMFADGISVGDSKSTDGVSIGGLGTGMYLRGELQEVQVFRSNLSQSIISQNRFADLVPADWPNLRGYYKLGYSSNPADHLRNFSSTAAAGTDPAAKSGTGAVAFEQTSRDGEQSLFDSTKNGGREAITPIAGGFDWSQTVFTRPTPGIPFEFAISYSSGNAFNKAPLEDFDPFEPSALGSGWRHTFEIRVLPSLAFNPGEGNQTLGLLVADGGIETWDYADSVGGRSVYKTRHHEYRGELEYIGSGPSDPNATVRWVTPDRMIYIFRSPNLSGSNAGRLKEIRDLNGNHLDVGLYETGERAGLVKTVTDTAGGVWTFNYNVQNRLESVSGLGWSVTFGYDSSNRLATRTITGPAAYDVPISTSWSFLYTAISSVDVLYRINNPRGLREVEIAYDPYGRKLSEISGGHDVDRITTYKYNVPILRQMTTTRQAAASPDPANDRTVVDTFDRKLRVLSHKDALGFVTSFEYDAAGNVTAATDAKGNRTTMTYDSRSNVLTSTDALGGTTRREYNHVLADGISHNEPTKEIRPGTEEAPAGWENRFTYDPAGNLLTHTDDLGTLAEHGYDARGLVTSSKDGNGNEIRFGYDSNGFQNSKTIAFGKPEAATWNSTRSELGWPLAETNPLGESTNLRYNLYGQVTRTEDAIGRIFTRSYDGNGNLTEESDGNGALTKYQYNAGDERTTRTDRLGNTWSFGYNAFGEPTSTTGPSVLSDGTTQQDTVTNTYNAGGRLVKVTDPYNDSTSFEYDSNGNQTASIDKLGKRWEKTYDALDRVVAERDPEGNIKSVSFDTVGRIKVVTTPNGNPSSHRYDGRSRLREWTDAEGYRWVYTYDGVGNILDIEDALHGHYVMTYGPRNERLTELNQDQKSWVYTYDPLIRLKTQLDPNGTKRTLAYDEAGRLNAVEFNTNRINSLGYDNNNNVVSVIRSKPGSPNTALYLAYDPLDRLTETRDTFSKTVRYSYDALGRVRTKTYPGGKVLTQTYDRLGRLKGLSFAWSATQNHACSFTYDKAGRLTGRTYPNGITQTNGFDHSGRLTTLDYKASGGSSLVALGYAYDRNGNKVGGSEQGTLDWQAGATPNYDEQSRFTAAGKLIDRTDTDPAIPKVMNYTYDDSGNMTLASAPGESYALAYDEDNRTTSLHWENGLTSKDIVNRYDALGRRISRNADGIETRYVLDLVGGMERILCDTDASGNITAWYVHGADLCFKVTNTGAPTCYHADAMGNVVRATDTTGATVNQYAYTPYGRNLDTADSASIPDPYRFVGSQGVMLELPGLYFMRARYYSADVAVFLSKDPLKNIGPRWKPEIYGYGAGNPTRYSDPTGLYVKIGIMGGVNLELIEGASVDFSLALVGTQERVTHGEFKAGASWDHGFGGGGHVDVVQFGQGTLDPNELAGAQIKAEACLYILAGGCVNYSTGSGLGGGVGFGAQASAKVGYGVSISPITIVKNAIAWAAAEPMPSHGGNVANSTPAFINRQVSPSASGAASSKAGSSSSLSNGTATTNSSGGKSGGKGASGNWSEGAVAAASYADGANSWQGSKVANSTPPTVSTSGGSSSIGKLISGAVSFVTNVASSAWSRLMSHFRK